MSFNYMSSASPHDPVQIIFNDTNTERRPNEMDTRYKDYIISQNVMLHKEHTDMTEEVRELKSRINELEEQLDQHDRQTDKHKQYMKNFYHQSEIYRNIVKKDHTYFVELVRQDKDDEIRRQATNSAMSNATNKIQDTLELYVMVLIIIIQCYFSAMLATTISCGLIMIYYRYRPTSVHNTMKDHIVRIKDLQAYKAQEYKELQGLKKTMDIIGEFIDNGL